MRALLQELFSSLCKHTALRSALQSAVHDGVRASGVTRSDSCSGQMMLQACMEEMLNQQNDRYSHETLLLLLMHTTWAFCLWIASHFPFGPWAPRSCPTPPFPLLSIYSTITQGGASIYLRSILLRTKRVGPAVVVYSDLPMHTCTWETEQCVHGGQLG